MFLLLAGSFGAWHTVFLRSEWIEKRRTMMQAWADYLDALKAGIDPAAAAAQFRLSGK